MESAPNEQPEQPKPGSRRAWGRRHMTADSIAGSIDARTFTGLPEGVARPFELLGALKRARAQLSVPAEIIDLIDCLFSFTEPQDWQPGSRPIVWPSNSLLAHQLGVTRSGIKKRIRRAIELRLISEKPSPNGKRFGHRTRSLLSLDHSFGFDLSLMAVRHVEFTAAAEHGQRLYQAAKAVQRRGYAAKTALLQLIETATDEGLWTRYWDELEARAEGVFPGLAGLDQPCLLTHATQTLESMRLDAEAVLTRALDDRANSMASGVNSNPKGPAGGPLYNSTNDLPETQSTGRSIRESSPDVAATPEIDARFSASVVIDAAPEIGAYCQSPYPDWNELADSARLSCPQFDISQRLWGRACQALGRHGAALALAVMIHQTRQKPVGSPGGYFHNMIARAERGELDLQRSYYGMRARLWGGSTRTH